MIGWLSLTDEQRKATIDEAARLSGINPKAIEKDWWVTLILKALFECEYAPLMIFKGGTSLSKCWNLIERFSEDIDIALDPKAFSHEHKKNPTSGEVRRLKRAGCVFTSTLLKETLQKQLGFIGVLRGKITIVPEAINDEMPDKDPQILFATYISLYDPHLYLQDAVKIEVSVRSLMEPHRVQPTNSMLYQYFPNPAYLELPLNIASVEPRKTFLEKVFLLHEEFLKPEIAKIRVERMSGICMTFPECLNGESI
ncbi:MAG: nucleotidyl transferase AbiEii/AbiGii toxin family protein [Puia sp.]